MFLNIFNNNVMFVVIIIIVVIIEYGFDRYLGPGRVSPILFPGVVVKTLRNAMYKCNFLITTS